MFVEHENNIIQKIKHPGVKKKVMYYMNAINLACFSIEHDCRTSK